MHKSNEHKHSVRTFATRPKIITLRFILMIVLREMCIMCPAYRFSAVHPGVAMVRIGVVWILFAGLLKATGERRFNTLGQNR